MILTLVSSSFFFFGRKSSNIRKDIVIGGTYDLACQQFVNISKEINWAPNAIIMSVCLGSIKQYQAYLGEDGR